MTMTTDGKASLEFVNDWSELEEAVGYLQWHIDTDFEDIDLERALDRFQVFATYVPRLLTQYASLVELSFALTEGWEQYASLQAPAGLYLPDHR